MTWTPSAESWISALTSSLSNCSGSSSTTAPLGRRARHPLTDIEIDFSTTTVAKRNQEFLDTLEMMPDFAVRRGELDMTGWKLGSAAQRNLHRGKPLESNDLVPDISQKGVDIRIGLDIATLALKRLAQAIVLVTGDSDLIPAMKLARKEGVRVYLETLGHPVKRQLKAHADQVFETS